MRSSYTTLMQSKYYNPAFNSAIFDGPVRIYFAQFHEALALKIYFLIQQKLEAEMSRAKDMSRASGANILVMIYPTEESFLLSYEKSVPGGAPIEVERWQEDIMVGLRGPIADENLDLLLETLRETMRSWRPAPLSPVSAPAEL
ncbi:MAG: hypothetical protein AAGB31_09690 [Bdellovibrio sp.]